MSELGEAFGLVVEACADLGHDLMSRVRRPRAIVKQYRVRWTYLTRDQDWGLLVGEHPELHELAAPAVMDVVLDPAGDLVFMPTPDGGVTAVIALAAPKANELVDAWRKYQAFLEQDDEDADDEDQEETDAASDYLDDWMRSLMEHLEHAIHNKDRWEKQ